MNRIPPVKSVMTPFPHFIDVDESAAKAMEMMLDLEIRHLPVKRGGRLVSVVSHDDIVAARGRGGSGPLPVSDVCASGAYIVDLSERLDRVLAHMAERHLGAALVVKEGRLAGIFTTTDACRLLGRLLRDWYGDGDGGDAA